MIEINKDNREREHTAFCGYLLCVKYFDILDSHFIIRKNNPFC